MSDNETAPNLADDISAFIRDMQGRGGPNAPPPPQPAPRPQPQAHDPTPSPPEPPKPPVRFRFNNQKESFTVENATPANVAARFGIADEEDIELERRDGSKSVVENDAFVPPLIAGKAYKVIERAQNPSPQFTPTPSPPPGPSRTNHGNTRHPRPPPRNAPSQRDTCTLVFENDIKPDKSIATRKSEINQMFGVSDFRLIDEQGNIQHDRRFELKPGMTYYVISSKQTPLKIYHGDAPIYTTREFADASLCRPLCYMGPYIIYLDRALNVLGNTGDTISLEIDQGVDPKAKSKLLCPKTLSTCAYQIAHRFNEAAKALQITINNISDKITANKSPTYDFRDEFNPPHSFDDDYDDEKDRLFPTHDIGHIVALLKETLEEIEECLDLVIVKMKTSNPCIQTVKDILKIKNCQKERNEERIKVEALIENEKEEPSLYEIISNERNNQKICPKGNIDDAVKNRKHFCAVNRHLRNVIDHPQDAYTDVATILNFCAEIVHYNLIYWMIGHMVAKDLQTKANDEAGGKETQPSYKLAFLATQFFKISQVWRTVSEAVPLSTHMDEEDTTLESLWDKLQNDVNLAQYGLEIFAILEFSQRSDIGTKPHH